MSAAAGKPVTLRVLGGGRRPLRFLPAVFLVLFLLGAVVVNQRRAVLRLLAKPITDSFHYLFYAQSEVETRWLGTAIMKNPFDLWIFQEILYESKPDLIIEAGTGQGGSALYMASLCDLMTHGQVVTIDIEQVTGRPEHKRISYLLGSSTSGNVLNAVKRLIRPQDKVMVVLDSDHSKDHVLRELRLYSPLVTKGNYLIVEDTNVNGHPVAFFYGPGPMEAVEEFLRENKDFVPDRSREKYLLTFNPSGYLRKVR